MNCELVIFCCFGVVVLSSVIAYMIAYILCRFATQYTLNEPTLLPFVLKPIASVILFCEKSNSIYPPHLMHVQINSNKKTNSI